MDLTPVDCVTEVFAYTYHLMEQLHGQDTAYGEVAANYDTLIRRARKRAGSAGVPKEAMDQALFPVMAWADETLLGSGWDEKSNWVNNSLQKRYFNTTNAGMEFFTRLDKLKDSQILEVYEYCLASGFKGKFFESYQAEELGAIHQSLQKKLWGGPRPSVPEVLFPQAGDASFGKRLKRKRWKGVSSYASIFILLPVLLFLSLYYIFDLQLNRILQHSGL